MFRLFCVIIAVMTLAAALGDSAFTVADEPKNAPGEKQIAVDLGDGAQLKLALIPSGTFEMGNGESSEVTAAYFKSAYDLDYPASALDIEHPQHRVRITKPFYLGLYDVTRGQFRQFVKDTGYITDAEKEEQRGARGWNAESHRIEFDARYSWKNAGFEQTDVHPVVNVTWDDAMAFCKWLSRKEGKTYRLPTEAEWEYACRAGTTTRYFSGDDPETLAKAANVADGVYRAKIRNSADAIKATDGYLFTSPVASFRPNAFGLYDMHGNVWQWCADSYDEEYYAHSPIDDPTGPEPGDRRGSILTHDFLSRVPLAKDAHVVRGGSWSEGGLSARAATRFSFPPSRRSVVIGFRVARD